MILQLLFSRKIIISLLIVLTITIAGCGGDTVIDSSKNTQPEQKSMDGYTWMTIRLPWEGSFNLPFIGSDTYKKDSEEPEINLDPSSPYTIYVTLGSIDRRIYNVVAIRSDGKAIAAYKDPSSYRVYQKKFELTKDELSSLTSILIKNKAGKLPASVVDPKEKGGVQGGFTIISHKAVRRSYFSNSWPSSFKNITEFINDKILRYSPSHKDNGFFEVKTSILTADPEATYAIRGLLKGK